MDLFKRILINHYEKSNRITNGSCSFKDLDDTGTLSIILSAVEEYSLNLLSINGIEKYFWIPVEISIKPSKFVTVLAKINDGTEHDVFWNGWCFSYCNREKFKGTVSNITHWKYKLP